MIPLITAKRDILGKIWWTPKDFKDATYALL